MIVMLADAVPLTRRLIGGKAATLALLAADGIAVPDGFVIPVDAEPTSDELDQAVRELGGDRLAVRSSAVAEDLAGASYAGLYETFLNVGRGAVPDAVRRCRASADAERVSAYRTQRADHGVAVLVQRMVDAEAAGVAFTANPMSGAREEIVITAVRGLGEALVSGEAVGEEWIVRNGRVGLTRTVHPGVLNTSRAAAVADLAHWVQDRLGGPQDIEWAIENDTVFLLQARPMTAVPEPIVWEPPAGGLWLRNFRLGEWLSDPVTPLFADWLLDRIDEGFRAGMRETAGAAVPFAYGTVNGWYYTRPNPAPHRLPGAALRSGGRLLPFMVNALLRPGRDPAGADRALLGGLYRHWREDLLPDYRRLAGRSMAGSSEAELIDEIGRTAGRHLWYLAVVGGAAWKMEACLARFVERHRLGVSPQLLLRGLPGTDQSVPGHAVHSIDWFHPTAAETGLAPADADPARRQMLHDQRIQAEWTCRDRLADRPKVLAEFAAMLSTTQRYAVIREEQARELTLGWPLLRTCLHNLGARLAVTGVVDEPSEVFFLTRPELDRPEGHGPLARQRKTVWERQRRLAAPLTLGTPPPIIGRHLTSTLGLARADSSGDDILTGQPASTGRASGPVRVVHGPADFDKVRPGDVLVARATAPAWTPLFSRVAAVVTDGGTLAAHASLIAREYGLPAVVATADATVRLRDDDVVTVDGTHGTVTIQRA